jgi:hypothetical protein
VRSWPGIRFETDLQAVIFITAALLVCPVVGRGFSAGRHFTFGFSLFAEVNPVRAALHTEYCRGPGWDLFRRSNRAA